MQISLGGPLRQALLGYGHSVATMADVARLAGVSVSTVSYAMTGVRPITTQTRERVHVAMRELGYTPHALARGLKSKRSRIIALLFPTSGRGLDLSSLDYILGACDLAQERGYHVMLWTSDEGEIQELHQLSRTGLVDGALVMEVKVSDSRIGVLSEAAVPFTTIGRTRRPRDTDYVDADFDQCTRLAMEHLHGLGHRRVCLVNQATGGVESPLGPARRGREGVLRAAGRLGVQVQVAAVEPSYEAGLRAFGELVGREPLTSAVIVMNEQALPGVIGGAAGMGRPVPTGCSVIAIGLAPQGAAMTVPPTSTVSPSGREMGRTAADVLIRRIEGENPPRHHQLFRGVLTERGTTGPAPGRA